MTLFETLHRDFRKPDAGRSLNAPCLNGFGARLTEGVSYALGRGGALNMVAEEL